jgi:hypothetical protein
MKRLLCVVLCFQLTITSQAQSLDCQIRLYKTYQHYQQDIYTCWKIEKFRSLFSPSLRLHVRGTNSRVKIIKENYWGCLLTYEGTDSLGIKQLFRFHPYTGVALAFQESRNDYAVFFLFLSYSKKPLKVISNSLEPAELTSDEFQPVDLDGVRIVLNRNNKGIKKSRAERKKILQEIKSIRPTSEMMKLRKLFRLRERKSFL